MTFTIHPAILCGGAGTRLWPLSTPQTPKQFLSLTSTQSMIEETAMRFQSTQRSDLEFAKPLVVGSKRHEALLRKQLPDADMVLEPMGRNSAPAVAAACLSRAPEDLILILPADHDIRDIDAFHDAIAIAAQAAEDGAIVTFGIEPTHPATGYGYIKTAGKTRSSLARDVEAFVEKPDSKTAQSYIDAGTYYWNAGIFLFKANVMSAALERFVPEVYAGTRKAMGDQIRAKIDLIAETFAETPSISIDYAVMEKASNVKTVPVSMGWSDVGGYRALHELLTNNASENYTSGPVHVQNSTGLYVRSEGPAIAVNGISNLVIVATDGEVMITPKNDDAAVKALGKVVQSDRYALDFSSALRERARDWLWTAFDVWSKIGWDPVRGGFVEQLHMDGTPDVDAVRRVRVQARQVFSFAKAIEMGWPGSQAAKALVDKGIDFIDTRLRHDDGGFVHLIDADGDPLDKRRDLYDHAFIILAGSAAYSSTGNLTALQLAQDALEYINSNLKDELHGGWFESSEFELPRRANPHMHMLEAMLELHKATDSQAALQHASEVVHLFETKFFNPKTDILAEYFNADWSCRESDDWVTWEPGHHYEWATLLSQYDAISGHDSLSYQRRMMRRADQSGLNSKTKFAFNALRAEKTLLNANSRLWHQLEMFRAHLIIPGLISRSETEALLRRVFEAYLQKGPSGGWLDEISERASDNSSVVPASMLYHVVTAFCILSNKQ
ncbi:MAG: AGE family epimerase/isomerase [Pseudomonadota bacterium]